MQKADCGLNLSGSCFWDNEVDGTVTVKWDSPSLICIVNIFGCALWSPSNIFCFINIHLLNNFTLAICIISLIKWMRAKPMLKVKSYEKQVI